MKSKRKGCLTEINCKWMACGGTNRDNTRLPPSILPIQVKIEISKKSLKERNETKD